MRSFSCATYIISNNKPPFPLGEKREHSRLRAGEIERETEAEGLLLDEIHQSTKGALAPAHASTSGTNPPFLPAARRVPASPPSFSKQLKHIFII